MRRFVSLQLRPGKSGKLGTDENSKPETSRPRLFLYRGERFTVW
jgi:hypothetical protein